VVIASSQIPFLTVLGTKNNLVSRVSEDYIFDVSLWWIAWFLPHITYRSKPGGYGVSHTLPIFLGVIEHVYSVDCSGWWFIAVCFYCCRRVRSAGESSCRRVRLVRGSWHLRAPSANVSEELTAYFYSSWSVDRWNTHQGHSACTIFFDSVYPYPCHWCCGNLLTQFSPSTKNNTAFLRSGTTRHNSSKSTVTVTILTWWRQDETWKTESECFA